MLGLSLTAGPASAASIRVTADTRDCGIKNGTSASTSFCADSNLYVGSASTRRQRSLLYFDVAGALPANVEVTQATLNAYVTARSTTTGVQVDAHEVTRAWTSSATWNKATSTVSWSTAGGDFGATAAASAWVAATGAWVSWDVSATVSGWLGPNANLGLLLKRSAEGGSANELQSASASATSAQRPYLEITYRDRPMPDSAPAGMVFAARTSPGADYGIWRADADGSNPEIARWIGPTRQGIPALSSDGHLVAWRHAADNNASAISVLDLRTATVTDVYTSTAWASVSDAKWVPNSDRVVFTANNDVLAVNADGSGLAGQPIATTNDIAAAPAIQAVISPDGQSVVYSAYVTGSNKRAVFISDINGTNARILTDAQNYYPFRVAVSRDGSKIAFAQTIGASSTVYTMNLDGTDLQEAAGSLAFEGGIEWTPEGGIAITTGIPEADITIAGSDTAGLAARLNAFDSVYGPSFPQAVQDLSDLDSNELLARYAPALNYDSAENYSADSPAVLTDSYVDSPPESVHSNQLLDAQGNVLADSAPQVVVGIPQLTLGMLSGGPYYNDDGPEVDSGDSIDAYGDSDDEYVPDAQRMHATPGLGDQIYGRAVQDGGMTWLQYWFFYYSDWVPGVFEAGDHEGDWEMAQIGLDSTTNQPIVVTFSAHKDEQRSCLWSEVHKSWGAGSWAPDVYVALGSHASYPAPGSYDRPVPLPTDQTDGARQALPNMVAGEFDGAGADWTQWPGFWGNSHAGSLPWEQDSPTGPRFQGQGRWSAPATFNANAQPCHAGEAGAAPRGAAQATRDRGASTSRYAVAPTPRRVPKTRSRRLVPKVSTRLVDRRHVRVSYRFTTLRTPGGQRLHSLLVTGRSRSRDAQPRTYGYRLRKRRGTITQDLPLGRGPYTIRVAALTRRGTIVAKTTVRVQK